MYELLCEYARKFGKDFPISAVMDSSNENGVIQLVQKALAEGKPYEAPKPAKEGKDGGKGKDKSDKAK